MQDCCKTSLQPHQKCNIAAPQADWSCQKQEWGLEWFKTKNDTAEKIPPWAFCSLSEGQNICAGEAQSGLRPAQLSRVIAWGSILQLQTVSDRDSPAEMFSWQGQHQLSTEEKRVETLKRAKISSLPTLPLPDL